MNLSVDFDVLVTFDCTYGRSSLENSVLRVFVEKGLVLPYCQIKSGGEGLSLIKCDKDISQHVEGMFPVHYIYDLARQAEYVEWELVDGLLKARDASGEWVQYKSKAESSYAMNEFVGGCWFVFNEVVFFKRLVGQYASDHQDPSYNKDVEAYGSHSSISPPFKRYLLEGVLDVMPGPGWMSWEICAKGFYIEIPDYPVSVLI